MEDQFRNVGITTVEVVNVIVSAFLVNALVKRKRLLKIEVRSEITSSTNFWPLAGLIQLESAIEA